MRHCAAEWLIISHAESEDENGLCLKPRQLDFISYPYEVEFFLLQTGALNTLANRRRGKSNTA